MLKMQIFDSVCLEWGLRFYISNKFLVNLCCLSLYLEWKGTKRAKNGPKPAEETAYTRT